MDVCGVCVKSIALSSILSSYGKKDRFKAYFSNILYSLARNRKHFSICDSNLTKKGKKSEKKTGKMHIHRLNIL